MQEMAQPARETKNKFFYGYIIVAVAFVCGGLVFGPRSTFGLFLQPTLDELGWTRAQLSGAYSIGQLLSGFLALIAGGLNDRFGPRAVVTVCGLLSGLGYLLMWQVHSTWQVYLFYGILVPLGMTSLTPILSTIARWFTKKRMTATGVAIVGNSVGVTVFPILTTWLIADFGWRDAYLIIGLAVGIIMAGSAQLLKRAPGQTSQGSTGQTSSASANIQTTGLTFRQAAGTLQFWLLFSLHFLNFLSVHSVFTQLVPHAMDLGISAPTAASFISILGFGAAIGRISTGPFADRIGAKKSLVIIFGLEASSLAWLLVARDPWAFYLFTAVYALGYGSFVVIPSPIAAEIFGLRSHGAIYGATSIGGTISGAIGPVLAALIFDATLSYHAAFLIFSIGAMMALVLTLFIRPVRIEANPS